MEALPKQIDEFREQEYWKNFYQQEEIVKKHGFEWYAEYQEVKPLLDSSFATICKGTTKKDAHVLVPGCGDSKLGHEMRLDGYGKITNIDFEEEVIDRMKIGRGVEGVEDYIKMDILYMNGIDDKSIDLSIDKGTLDALYSGKDSKNEKEVDKYFNELQRVTKSNNGQIAFISLLQSHILKKIIKFFLVNEDGANTSHSNCITEVKIQEI